MTPLPALLMTGLVLATAADTQHQDEYNRDVDRNGDDASFKQPLHVTYESVSCDQVSQQMRESSCSIVEMFVDAIENGEHMYNNSRIKVKKCSGTCSSGRTCVSASKNTVKLPVMRTRLSTEAQECAYAVVEEDTSCSCNCFIGPQDCSKEQVYDGDTCQCLCEDKATKRNKCAYQGKAWVEESCECRCPVGKRRCSIGRRWDEESCRCVSRGRNKYSHWGR